MSVSRGRPRAEGGGRSGSITNHSPSVVSLSYRMPSRLYCGRVILVQTIVLSFESIHPKESQLAEITQFLFQSDTNTNSAIRVPNRLTKSSGGRSSGDSLSVTSISSTFDVVSKCHFDACMAYSRECQC